jgi:hypothetical protein
VADVRLEIILRRGEAVHPAGTRFKALRDAVAQFSRYLTQELAEQEAQRLLRALSEVARG